MQQQGSDRATAHLQALGPHLLAMESNEVCRNLERVQNRYSRVPTMTFHNPARCSYQHRLLEDSYILLCHVLEPH